MRKEHKNSDNVTPDDRIWAAIAYLFTPLSPIFIHFMREKRARPFIRSHYIQALSSGVFLALFEIPMLLFTIGCSSILWFVFPFWAYKAYNGETIEIPIITDFVRKHNWA